MKWLPSSENTARRPVPARRRDTRRSTAATVTGGHDRAEALVVSGAAGALASAGVQVLHVQGKHGGADPAPTGEVPYIVVEFTDTTNVSPNAWPGAITNVGIFFTANDLEQTVRFYNSAFGLAIPTPMPSASSATTMVLSTDCRGRREAYRITPHPHIAKSHGRGGPGIRRFRLALHGWIPAARACRALSDR